MRVKVWGARGSIPCPGPDTVRYGGNTSCVQVTLADGTQLVLDAGTGIRNLRLPEHAAARQRRAAPHPHPADAPAPRPHPGPAVLPGTLRSAQRDHDLGSDRPRLDAARPHRPLHVRPADSGRAARAAVPPGVQRLPAASGRSARPSSARRPSTTAARRSASASPIPTRRSRYIPDHEPALIGPLDELDPAWISGYALAHDADLLLHDCQYTDAEYPAHFGWGHSSISDALTFARRTNAKRTLLSHHDPYHSDEQLDAVYDDAIESLARARRRARRDRDGGRARRGRGRGRRGQRSSIRAMTSSAPALCSGSLRLPHFGD